MALLELEGIRLVDLEIVETIIFEWGEDKIRFSTVRRHCFSFKDRVENIVLVRLNLNIL